MPKRLNLIAVNKVPVVFDDSCIKQLAALSELPSNADKARFGQSIRDAVLIYLRDASVPNHNDINREIAKLHQAAHHCRYAKAESILMALSAEARQLLSRRRNHPGTALLSDPSPLRDPVLQKASAGQLAAICRIGAPWGGLAIEGRKRTGGHRSKTFTVHLYAPPASSNFEKRAAERTFLMWLRVAWSDATGEIQRAFTAHYDHPGPFALFVRECLKLAGATHVDAIGLINDARERMNRQENSLSGNKS
jgi:hypothetical protein